MENNVSKYKVLVIGAGPAGTGLLYNAINRNMKDEFLHEGIAFADKKEHFGCGSIGRYLINSDTASSVFLECLQSFNPGAKGRLDTLIKIFSRKGQRPVPLEWVGDYLTLLGKELRKIIDEHPRCNFYPGTEALDVCRLEDGTFCTTLKNKDTTFKVISQSVVFAMGGRQEHTRLLNDLVNTVPLADYHKKIIGTDQLFTRDGFRSAKKRLEQGNRKVVVIGGSHSAFSSVNLFLRRAGEIPFQDGEIVLLHRSRLKLFYNTREEALAEGYTDFTDDEICPLTKKVHRLSGLRLESRDLLRNLLGLNGVADPRVTLINSGPPEKALYIEKLLTDAALIVPAFGYRPVSVPVYEKSERIQLSAESGGPLVNKHCQVIDYKGEAVQGLFGVGLASGFVPWGKLGGEPGFVGQTNGLWLYQNGIGEMILEQLLTSAKKTDEVMSL